MVVDVPSIGEGKRGFFGHNLALFLAPLGVVALLRRSRLELPEMLCGACWATSTWLVYALLSNNYSGHAASIRWFVPLLAPGYFALAILLRDEPRYRKDLLLLSGWGTLLAALMWWKGPWMPQMVPFFWPIQAAALLTWILGRSRWRREEAASSSSRAGPRGQAHTP